MRVEVTVRRSLWRWYAVWGLTLGAVVLTLLLEVPYYLALIWFVLPWIMYWYWRAEYSFAYIRMDDAKLECWDTDDQVHCFEWRGVGRLTSFFISFEVINENGQVIDLVIWRDSLIDPSWRALNMAYRVALPNARKLQNLDELND